MYRLLVVFSVFIAACAQMLLKQGAIKQYASWRQYINYWVIGGYGLMGLSLLLNIYCLSKGVMVKEVGIIESLSYLFVPLLSWLFFREVITWRKIMAIVTIMIGVIVFFS